MAQILKDFSDIYSSVLEKTGISSTDTTRLNRVKRIINEVYVNKIVPLKRWWWLKGEYSVVHKAVYTTGTISITQDSTSVTLSAAPSASDGSFKDYYIKVDDYEEIIKITAHTAEATSITLDTAYTGDTNATASFKIWKPWVALPTDCRETMEVWTDHSTRPLDGMGIQEFRQETMRNPDAQARPYAYTTEDFYDPSSGDAETESDRYRILRLFPAIYDERTTIHIDYIKEVAGLDLDADEPLMPIEDRISIVDGALEVVWEQILRNPEEAQLAKGRFEQKLAYMAGKLQDSTDTPTITLKNTYMRSKRLPRRRRRSRRYE